MQAWGGPAAGHAVAGQRARHLRRRPGQRLAGRQRRQGRDDPEVHARRQVPAADRRAGRDRRRRNDTAHLNRPANIVVDPATRELFVADGYGNHRVIVFDAETGAYKRHWGANGRPPRTTPSVKGFAQPRALRAPLARRPRLRLRPREQPHPGLPQGRHLRAGVHRGAGDARQRLDLGPRPLARTPRRRYLYTADGENNQVWLLAARERRSPRLASGATGARPGQFHWVHNMAVDSMGNIYTTEVDTGKRAQKFVLKTR